MSSKRDYIASSGNVFADLGLPRSEEALAKAELVQKIVAIIEQRRLTQTEAAEILGVDQPKIAALKRGRSSGFALERLVKFLILLGQDVEILVN